jgi:hypothetical protein
MLIVADADAGEATHYFLRQVRGKNQIRIETCFIIRILVLEIE